MKGRGALSNPINRYLQQVVDTNPGERLQDQASIVTEIIPEQPKTIISTNQSPDVPFEQSINPYRGCEHGCIYCFARPSHANWDMSPGLDFETRIVVKEGVAELLRKALEKPRYKVKTLMLGANTDPYQPVERRFRNTRQVLELCLEYRHPVALLTKSAMVLDDLDLLTELARLDLVNASFSVTTLDNGLKRVMEPRTSSGSQRLNAMRTLTEAGIPCGMMVAPIIPFINDAEIEAILKAGREAGAGSASWVMLRLPLEINQLFEDWLKEHFPDRAQRVLHAIESVRDGKRYDSRWRLRQRGTGTLADLIARRFRVARKRFGYPEGPLPPLRTDLFRVPGPQMDLF